MAKNFLNWKAYFFKIDNSGVTEGRTWLGRMDFGVITWKMTLHAKISMKILDIS
jgi:hypothetical protein